MLARVRARVVAIPGEGFADQVALDLDVGRDEVRDGGAGTAEQDIFTRAFQIVVVDLERSRAVPAGNGLAILPIDFEAGNVTIDDAGRGAIQGDATLERLIEPGMDVALVE